MSASPASEPRSWGDRLTLLIAEGLGSGRLPWGPGTWGSVLGVAWLIALVGAGSAAVFAVANAAAIFAAVAVCSRAETILNRHDPPSVVVDEIVAVPLTFLGPLLALGAWPEGVSGQPVRVLSAFWPELLTGFVAFRFFDIAKPGPIRRVQTLPRGWGVVADDVFAGLAAAVVTGLVTVLRLQ